MIVTLLRRVRPNVGAEFFATKTTEMPFVSIGMVLFHSVKTSPGCDSGVSITDLSWNMRTGILCANLEDCDFSHMADDEYDEDREFYSRDGLIREWFASWIITDNVPEELI